MALAHEHVLACRSCNSPLFITRHDGDFQPKSTARKRLVLTYEHTVANILGGACSTPSFVRDMREDTADSQGQMGPSLTLLHVLHMEGFEKWDSRRNFAESCNLDPTVLENHFVNMSHLMRVDVGACWCECHDGRDRLEVGGRANMEEELIPSMPTPVMEHKVLERGASVLDSQGMHCEPKTKRKRMS